MEENLHPVYKRGLAASNCLTDARDAVWNLLDVLPQPKQVVVARLYTTLCQAQGELEKLLEDVPTVVRAETEDARAGGSDGE